MALDQATNIDPGWVRAQDAYNESGVTPYYMDSPDKIAELFTGLELVGPRLTSCPEWQPHTQCSPAARTLIAVGRKP